LTVFEKTLTELLGRGLPVRFCATGDSMYPSIRHGQHVHVAPAHPRTLQRGDIVLARASRGLTAHRIVRVTFDNVITRGDNALGRDAALHHNAILGRITHVEREGATVAVPSAPLRVRVLTRALRRHLSSLSLLVRSLL
jgi:phage repressor protein C with HTH and peptisase S24 domain